MKYKVDQFNRKMKLIELNKTPERKQFEEEYNCYIFSLRVPNNLSPDSKDLKWQIDTWHKVNKGKFDETSHIHNMITLRAKNNMAYVYGVWLPKELNTEGSDKIENPDLFYDLIFKYKFKL